MLRTTVVVTVLFLVFGCGQKVEEVPGRVTVHTSPATEEPEESQYIDPNEMTVGDQIKKAIDEYREAQPAEEPPPQEAYRPPIENLFVGIPADYLPPRLKPNDSLGWATLMNHVNSTLPRTLD